METLEDVNAEIRALTAKIDALTAKKKSEKLINIVTRLKSTTEDMAHTQKAVAYVTYKESEAYIDSLKAEIMASGATATNTLTGTQAAVKLSPDGSTAKTFDVLTPGATLDISGVAYLVTGFEKSYAGSTAALLRLGTKVLIDGQPVTPYSSIPCDFDCQNKWLTMSIHDRLQQDDIIVINDVKYLPINFVGTSPYFARYEVVEVTP